MTKSRLKDCRIKIDLHGMPKYRGGAQVHFSFVDLERCEICATSRIHDLDFRIFSRLFDCKFVGGPFTSPTFGLDRYEMPSNPDWVLSSVEQCDFSQAELRWARFYNVVETQVTLPKWPHLAVVGGTGTTGSLLSAVRSADWMDPECKDALDTFALSAGAPDYPQIPFLFVSHVEELMPGVDNARNSLLATVKRLAHSALRF